MSLLNKLLKFKQKLIIMKTPFLVLLFVAASLNNIFAQEKPAATAAKDTTSKPVSKRAAEQAKLKNMGVLYNKEWTIEGGIHTTGWSVGYNVAEIRTYYRTLFWHFGLEELRSPREATVSNTDGGGNSRSPRQYIYGKQNTLLNLEVGYGEKHYFSEKSDKNGIGVGYSYCFGGDLGILKPYYLDIRQSNPNRTQQQPIATRYTPETASTFLDVNKIDGAASFTNGFNQITPMPGVFGRFGLMLDWGSGEEFAKAAEAGIKINAYPIRMPLMVTEADNQAIFMNFYLIFQFGQRY